VPEGECRVRTGDRNDAKRMPGLVDPPVGVAPAINCERVGESLRSRQIPQLPWSWRTGPTGAIGNTEEIGIPTSIGGRRRCACEIGIGWSTSRVLSGERLHSIDFLRATGPRSRFQRRL